MSEQQGFPPRVFGLPEHFRNFDDVHFRLRRKLDIDVEYLSKDEHTALLSEAVREAKIGVWEEAARVCDRHDASSYCAIHFRAKAKAASTEGGKGGGE